MKPLIGITTNQSKTPYGQPTVMLMQSYINAVMQAGGVPVLIPSLIAEDGWETLYSRLDGILFSGGGDIGLEHSPGEPHPRIDDVDLARDSIELKMVQAAASDGKPFLGICRGCQVVNVALGGTLYTHIPDQLPNALDHSYPGNMRTTLVHEVKVEEGTQMAEIFGEPILRVNSLHHQGLKDIAPSVRVAGHAPDGLVEAVELPDHPFGLAVQWHPEWLTDQQPMRNLFRGLVQAAEK
ncbi:MAG TPA: gamma-glutamyl-gamma-aminobutyrate hydrolase family protein [Anaerolineales bacterium]|jgi:putative glutamine amidotransferase|nr:gamma-glutamyl-gamma-aminobutyrate hydrolase family protein [Anaerolineales bacterium]